MSLLLQAMRNGVRIGDLKDFVYFEKRLRGLVKQLQANYPELDVDIEAELAYYKSIQATIMELTADTVVLTNEALQRGKRVLIEGANATSKSLHQSPISYQLALTHRCYT